MENYTKQSSKKKPPKEKWFINKLIDAVSNIGFKKLKIFPRTYDFLLALSKFADKEGNCYPRQSQIENLCGIRSKDQHRHVKILKEQGYISVKRKSDTNVKIKYRGRTKMTRNYYSIHLNAILTISMGIDGDLRVDGIAVSPTNTGSQETCSETDQTRMVRVDQTRMARVATNITTHTTKLPIKTHLNIVQDEALDDLNSAEKVIEMTNDFYFEEFWATYPRKEKKKDAQKVWARNHLDKIADKIIADVRLRQVKHLPWLEGRSYIPLPTTYLNGERWNDDLIDSQTIAAKQEKFNSANHLVNEVRKNYENQRRNNSNVPDVSNHLLKKMD